MPDFKSEIRTSLAALNLSPTREEEIVEELSQDLQERFEEALSHGASEDEAKQLALNELTFPESIDNELKRVEQPVRSTELAIGAKKKGQPVCRFLGRHPVWPADAAEATRLRCCCHPDSRHRDRCNKCNVECGAG